MSPVDSALHEAVQHLYRDHHGWMYGWRHRRLGCADADLAQNTFARYRFASLGNPVVLRAYLNTLFDEDYSGAGLGAGRTLQLSASVDL